MVHPAFCIWQDGGWTRWSCCPWLSGFEAAFLWGRSYVLAGSKLCSQCCNAIEKDRSLRREWLKSTQRTIICKAEKTSAENLAKFLYKRLLQYLCQDVEEKGSFPYYNTIDTDQPKGGLCDKHHKDSPFPASRPRGKAYLPIGFSLFFLSLATIFLEV